MLTVYLSDLVLANYSIDYPYKFCIFTSIFVLATTTPVTRTLLLMKEDEILEGGTLLYNGNEETVQEEVQQEDSVLVPTEMVDNNANELCEFCGKLVHCECSRIPLENDVSSDNNNVHPSARTHQRTGKPLSRKRIRNPREWKGEKRKQLRQSGQSYTTKRGKLQPERSVQQCKVDHFKCRFKCSQKISVVSFTNNTGHSPIKKRGTSTLQLQPKWKK